MSELFHFPAITVDGEQPSRSTSRAAAASRRVNSTPSSFDDMLDLFHYCLKLLSQNKINEKHSWDLKLIDHLREIVKTEAENFLKASCALEVSVKIYSVRVDSLHSEAFKVLNGFNRTELENEQAEIECNNHESNYQESNIEETENKISPSATLESSLEALNLKKFDVAFSMEPLYRETSAMINDRGAKGLLLNNLGVYGDCCLFFSSLEVPGKERPRLDKNEGLAFIDLSFMNESTLQMVMNMRTKSEISPTLREIIYQFDNENQCSREALSDPGFKADRDDSFSNDNHEFSFDHIDNETTFHDHMENELSYSANEFDISMLLFQRESACPGYFNSEQNDWAGPDYWKYPNPIGTNKARATLKSTRSEKRKVVVEADLEFSLSVNEEMSDDIFAPPRNPKSLLLSVTRLRRGNSLPNDFRYEVKDLLKLFLLPNVQCLGKQQRIFSGTNSSEENNYCDEALPSWYEEIELSGEFDDGHISRDFEDPDRVNRDWVRFENTTLKQVDMTLLKQSLWDQMQQVVIESELDSNDDDSISFKRLMITFPIDSPRDSMTPQILFLCLLHLANEHGLIIHDCPSLDDLKIHLPSC